MTNEFLAMEFDSFDEALAHYGMPRRSGRYPWGSGDNPFQSAAGFLSYVQERLKQGASEATIAKEMGLKNSNDLRALKSVAIAQKRESDIQQALRLKDKNLSNVAIGKRMGVGESQVRQWLNPALRERNDILKTTTEHIQRQIDKHGFVDVGAGVENYLGISQTKKNVALAVLEREGYKRFYLNIEQLGTGEITKVMVFAKPDMTYPEVMANLDKMGVLTGYSEDGGRTYTPVAPPQNLSSDRIAVRYGPDGGAEKDGVIELRRGVEDLSMGNARYAQVRVAVDGTHYLKGMAMYADNMPDGVDVIFNTNKTSTGNKLDAMKPLKEDAENPEFIDTQNPFGSQVKQKRYIGADGKEKLSPLNIVGNETSANEEGRWHEWSRNLSSQMLAKQSVPLAQQQLDLTFKTKQDEFDEIMKLENPAVKRKLLQEFADGADASSVHLKAAGLPRTRSQVILPIESLKDNEVYAPNYKNGEKVVLIRHPHGGTFEIPELTVNNKNREALAVIPQARDAVGINSRVAARLSGADFDGDTVLVIPNNNRAIKSTPALEGLKDFDPMRYKLPDDSPIPRMTNKQKHMGDVSNLITDMTIRKASTDELARAVRHSMVVIDAEKHNLNYRQSALDNRIKDLKEKYQPKPDGKSGGASTLLSRAKSVERVDERKPRSAKDGGPVDAATGRKMWEFTNEEYVNKQGKVIRKQTKSTKMAETDDAHTLSSGTVMESVYADHANKLKGIANQARKAILETAPIPYSKEAKVQYQAEVDSLNRKLKTAQMNSPLERQAQVLGNTIVSAKRAANPQMDKDRLKKVRTQALDEARARTGAAKERVHFTDQEWAAVQAGAISNNKLTALLNNADMDRVRELATPRAKTGITPAKEARIKAMIRSGYTQAEVAEALGVSTSAVHDVIK